MTIGSTVPSLSTVEAERLQYGIGEVVENPTATLTALNHFKSLLFYEVFIFVCLVILGVLVSREAESNTKITVYSHSR